MTWVGTAALTIYTIAASVGTAVYSGETAKSNAKKGRKAQDQAQRQSMLAATAQDKLAAQAEAKANQKAPDINTILNEENTRADMGPGSTILAGRSGKPGLLGSNSQMGGG